MKSAGELLHAVRRVVAGSKYLSRDLQRKLQEAQWRNARFQSTASLTDRQRQVLKLLNEGCTMREIASGITQNRPVRVTSKPDNGEGSGH